jgi:RNA polymerase sigma factor for flagellar operon FliA
MKDQDRILWEKYRKHGDMDAREELLKANIPLVRFTIDRMTIPQNKSWLDIDDLMTAGIIGLIDAVEKFNPRLGGKFSTYAFFRIRGTILDEMRAMDWVPRSVRQKSREVEHAFETLTQRLHRPITDADMAKYMRLSMRNYQDLLNEINVPPVISLDEMMEDRDKKRRDVIPAEKNLPEKNISTAFTELASKEMREMITRLLDRLQEKERLVLTLYYYEELTLKEIASIMEVTESRVCQIHTHAVAKLRALMRVERHEFSLK